MIVSSFCGSENSIIILSPIIVFALLSNVTSQAALVKNSKIFQSCKATCSPHITLPCDFGSLDRCIMQSCQNACWKDGNRKVQSCFCRGSIEGPTLRACFCGPPKARKNNKSKGKLFFV
ncbi:hypothetical protein LOAG_06250 [Loa loa]|uniref:Uncharacterized protein n=1 Tax=Loa loa TaxID=7209 RepID=A0A1S0TYT6_LOALO|nr:hypothetical protein LOAG_06250 [Loa loa]EFO22234.1 hypothetical protein LOAG_06250 [Loa loa]